MVDVAHETLVDTATLARHLDDDAWAIVDCRFSLDDPDRGERAYLEAHIPGAVFAHLERDLSAAHVPGVTGRHPLPAPGTLAATFGAWGIGAGVQVVAYDDTGGSMAARLWWLLRWLGHDAVAVLDGGWQAWRAAGLPEATGRQERPAAAFRPAPRPALVADAPAVARASGEPDSVVLDARAADRVRGENETIDPVAGHIPGAVSAPYADNLRADGRFRPRAELRTRFEGALGGASPDAAIVYCGSGVTAAHDVLAMEHAGLSGARLYPGSWSEWITDPDRPVAVGGDR